MKRHATRLLLASPLAFLGLQAASAQDYIFTVPVLVKELPPEIREIEVNCAVSGAPPGGGSRETLGHGSVRQSVKGGFSGDVKVPVRKDALAGMRVPTHWYCYLRAYGTISGRPVEFWSYDDPATGQYGLKSPPGTTPRLEVPADPKAAKVVSVGGELPRAK